MVEREMGCTEGRELMMRRRGEGEGGGEGGGEELSVKVV